MSRVKTALRTPWFWAIVGIAVLLLINSIKNPAYLALSVNPTTGLLTGNVLDILRGGLDSAVLGLGHRSIEELSPEDFYIPAGFRRVLGAGDGAASAPAPTSKPAARKPAARKPRSSTARAGTDDTVALGKR